MGYSGATVHLYAIQKNKVCNACTWKTVLKDKVIVVTNYYAAIIESEIDDYMCKSTEICDETVLLKIFFSSTPSGPGFSRCF